MTGTASVLVTGEFQFPILTTVERGLGLQVSPPNHPLVGTANACEASVTVCVCLSSSKPRGPRDVLPANETPKHTLRRTLPPNHRIPLHPVPLQRQCIGMSHRSPSPLSSPGPVCSLDGAGSGLKPQGRPEEHVSGTPNHAGPPGQVIVVPKFQSWPEEDFALSSDEGGGFYPVRLGETFDDGRFVITRKLGWGGFSSVWLAGDRKYVPTTNDLFLTNGLFESTERIATLPSRSYLPMHRGKSKRDCCVNVTSFKRSQTQHQIIPDFSTWSISWTSSHSRVPLADTFVSS